jgi:CheY-like chemotaxis protein
MKDVQILVIAEHAMIGALLGALVELAGHRPRFAEAGEAADAAVERLAPDLVLVDCEHPAAADDAAYRAAFDVGGRIVLFGSSLNAAETERFAARRGVPCITLPIGYTAFNQRLSTLLDAGPGRPTTQRELRDQASA